MPEYQFRLMAHDAPTPLFEAVDAVDDEEARSLAEIRFLLSQGVARVAIVRSGVQIVRVGQEGATILSAAGAPGPSCDAIATGRGGMRKA